MGVEGGSRASVEVAAGRERSRDGLGRSRQPTSATLLCAGGVGAVGGGGVAWPWVGCGTGPVTGGRLVASARLRSRCGVRNRPRVAVWWHRSGHRRRRGRRVSSATAWNRPGYEGVVVYGTGRGWLSGGIDPATKALWCTEPATGGRLVAPIRPPAPQGATGVHGRRRPPLTRMVRPPWPRRSRPGSGAGRPWPAAPRGSWRQRRRAHADRPAGSRPPPPGAPAPRPAASRSA